MSGWVAAAETALDVGTQAANYASAKQQRDWQYHLSSTAHQREVNDLVKAHLNPILSAQGGSGASTPSGAMATFTNPGRGLYQGSSSARQAGAAEVTSKAVANSANAQAELSKSQARKTDVESGYIAKSALAQQEQGFSAAKLANQQRNESYYRTKGLKLKGDFFDEADKYFNGVINGLKDRQNSGKSLKELQDDSPKLKYKLFKSLPDW
ncbi:MAG: DNA pilot protein [Microvirus sp.]|nr:MAG: DNA pilot protein [Microvirus sp.]